MNWRVLLTKSDLSVNIMPDVVCAYAILNNMILSDRDVDVDAMIEIMEREMENLFQQDDDNGGPQQGLWLQHGAEALQTRLQHYLGRQRVHDL
jgi:hypothetical protein